ncbi:hypothetical protein ABZ027_00960 [Streptomyces sp. NPDC006332]|uniref:hypothetical protein n=1 Tax=Streptomyces sp. NPDC006332 TaxID=3155456 RepID=UPI0033B04927
MRGPIGPSRCSPHPAKPSDEYDVTDIPNVAPAGSPTTSRRTVEAAGTLGDLAAAKAVTVSQLAPGLAAHPG